MLALPATGTARARRTRNSLLRQKSSPPSLLLALTLSLLAAASLPVSTTATTFSSLDSPHLSQNQYARLRANLDSSSHTFGSLSDPAPPTAATALSPADRAALLAHYAPIVYLHPQDRWRPQDPALVYEKCPRSTDTDKHGVEEAIIAVPREWEYGVPVEDDASVRAPVSGRVLFGAERVEVDEDDEEMELTDATTGKGKSRKGRPISAEEQTRVYLQVKVLSDGRVGEHITVQLSGNWSGGPISTAPSISRVFFSQHSGGQWASRPTLRFEGTHPIGYSAMNSHAMYPTQGTHKNTDAAFSFVSHIAPLLTLGAVQWIQIADIADLTSDLYTYDLPSVVWGKFVAWRTWEEKVWDLTDWDELPPWGRFPGRWGVAYDQTNVTAPPEGVSARGQLHAAVSTLCSFFYGVDGVDAYPRLNIHLPLPKTAQNLGLLKKFVRAKDRAPPGPRQHYSWYHLDYPPM
ncbi:hypothetical protein BDK51DRAFT_45429 [Blyttiomyces helicus]|uniref:Uncharacterized protein n=1 Tax=Blyttiomyces helicus TaxID=388810 RepID=A0A4P9W6P8_9FUNG|nr:hypothetical protein BDK51DRAFT_45429 [Blyttiomyces helicus]|eukprot:RKO87053.1 hypothetical protein BDK51DRAFT_45429 [Blyttiomyces helicus]